MPAEKGGKSRRRLRSAQFGRLCTIDRICGFLSPASLASGGGLGNRRAVDDSTDDDAHRTIADTGCREDVVEQAGNVNELGQRLLGMFRCRGTDAHSVL